MPLARVTLWVAGDRTIHLQGRPYAAAKRHAGQYGKATVFTDQRELRIHVGNSRLKCDPFPIRGPAVTPLSLTGKARIWGEHDLLARHDYYSKSARF